MDAVGVAKAARVAVENERAVVPIRSDLTPVFFSTTSTWSGSNWGTVFTTNASAPGERRPRCRFSGASSENYFARTFENHRFYRPYALSVDDRTWLLEGETERARTVFTADGKTQKITWEWLQNGKPSVPTSRETAFARYLCPDGWRMASRPCPSDPQFLVVKVSTKSVSSA